MMNILLKHQESGKQYMILAASGDLSQFMIVRALAVKQSVNDVSQGKIMFISAKDLKEGYKYVRNYSV